MQSRKQNKQRFKKDHLSVPQVPEEMVLFVYIYG